MITNLFPSECSYVCAANPIWCTFTDIQVAATLSIIVLVVILITNILSPRINYSVAGVDCGIDWAHYIISYPIMNIIFFVVSFGLVLLTGIILRWIS